MEKIFSKELMTSNMEAALSVFKNNDSVERSLVAFIGTAQGKSLIPQKISECRKILTSEHGILSESRGNMEMPLIVKMSLSDDPRTYLHGVYDVYGKLSAKNKLGNESRLLAAVLIYENTGADDLDSVCEKAIDIYDKVKNEHPILANQDVLPQIALIAMKGIDTNKAINDVRECYNVLNGKFKGAALAVSNMLVLNDNKPAEKCSEFVRMYEAFDKIKMTLKGVYAPVPAVPVTMGLTPENAVDETAHIESELKKIKGFSGVFGIDEPVRYTYAVLAAALNNIKPDTFINESVIESVAIMIILMRLAHYGLR
jgi:hypothetical protein